MLAVYYAILTRKTFNAGFTVGNLHSAKQYSKLCEKFIIVSLVLGLFALVVVFSVVEKDKTYLYHMNSGHF